MKTYTDLLGFVIIPDNKTQEALEKLTKRYSQKGDFLPDPYHLSLYHGNLENFPVTTAIDLLNKLKFLVGTTYSLNSIEPFGEKFLFYNVKKPYNKLQKAHEIILKGIAGFVDKDRAGIALKEGLKMPKQQLDNIKKYSYPLVGDLFMPHYSLLYRKGGINNKGKLEHTAEIKEIQFVEIGGFSKINKVILTTSK